MRGKDLGASGDSDGGARVARIKVPVPDDVQRAYEAHVLPALIAIVSEWWTQYAGADKPEWNVSASRDAGICIDAPDDDPQDNIVCPRELNDATLLIGWQRYRNVSIRDLKCEIAEKLIHAVLRSDALSGYVDIEHMDDIAEDLGLYQQGSDYMSSGDEGDEDDDNADRDGEGDEDEDDDDGAYDEDDDEAVDREYEDERIREEAEAGCTGGAGVIDCVLKSENMSAAQ